MIEILISIPLIIGAIVAFSKHIVAWTNKFNDWVIEKRKEFAEKECLTSKYFFRPLFWGLFKIMKWSEKKFDDDFVRSGVRIALILYFISAVIFVASVAILVIIAIVIVFLVLIIIGWLLSLGEEKKVTYVSSKYIPRSDLLGSQPGSGVLTELFDTKSVEIDANLRVHEIGGLEIGEIDKDGNIYDTRGVIRTNVGFIDENGDIYDTRKMIRTKIGYIDENGQIKKYL